MNKQSENTKKKQNENHNLDESNVNIVFIKPNVFLLCLSVKKSLMKKEKKIEGNK